jgi:thiosulfate reductase cytochrome b subunit
MKTRRVDLYTLFERLWHWLQALTIVLLLVTGLEIHSPSVRLFGFHRAAAVHEVLALFTIANAFLSLFYHLATGAIRQFFPAPADFFSLAIAQASYYVRGIFRGEAHPFVRHPARKLNVLQQVTYLVVLNLVLPLEVASGALMWKPRLFAPVLSALGGLGAVATVHVACAWIFAAFIVMHIYLATTGPTPLALIKAMIVGWEEIPEETADGDRKAGAKS